MNCTRNLSNGLWNSTTLCCYLNSKHKRWQDAQTEGQEVKQPEPCQDGLIIDSNRDYSTRQENIHGAKLLSAMNTIHPRHAENVGFFIKNQVQAKKNKCPQCNVEMDRDINAARNILLRYLTLNRAESKDSALGLTPLSSNGLMQDLDKGDHE